MPGSSRGGRPAVVKDGERTVKGSGRRRTRTVKGSERQCPHSPPRAGRPSAPADAAPGPEAQYRRRHPPPIVPQPRRARSLLRLPRGIGTAGGGRRPPDRPCRRCLRTTVQRRCLSHEHGRAGKAKGSVLVTETVEARDKGSVLPPHRSGAGRSLPGGRTSARQRPAEPPLRMVFSPWVVLARCCFVTAACGVPRDQVMAALMVSGARHGHSSTAATPTNTGVQPWAPPKEHCWNSRGRERT